MLHVSSNVESVKIFRDLFRNSRLQIFFKIGVLKNLAIITKKHLCLSLIFLIPFLKNISGGCFWLLLTSNIHQTTIVWYYNHSTQAFRSSRTEVFRKKGVVRNFAKFTEKHLCQSVFL